MARYVTIALPLSLLLLTDLRAHGDPISDKLQLPPLREHLYVFDVISDAPVHDVKAALSHPGLDNVHSFKVIGERRFLFVVESNNTSALRSLVFPVGSEVTSHTVEHVTEFLASLGAEHMWEEPDHTDNLPDTVLRLQEWQFVLPETLCLERYQKELIDLATATAKTHDLGHFASYPLIAKYPQKAYIFNDMEDNAFQNVVLENMNTMGPGRILLTNARIVKI